ncbi:hypothetical protein [Maridesulfovibrio bastinii]|uniref:hypothetical protein n=1 Tax=Maridesulfovibrio bastinii TaxID=47157 RepID=UPI000407183C|nr:hypothetical protein [Maridesulfovibrio bastinii]
MNSRLDLLVYAHDGRGLGHVSRSAAVAMAFKRLYADRSVLLMTGCSKTTDLTEGRVDWLKLPSYETSIVSGVSAGVSGPSGFADNDLGLLRSVMIDDIVKNFKPAVVLADHTPQGKHRELVKALEENHGSDTRWLLGIRGVVGEVGKVWSDFASDLYSRHYHGLIWYGDQKVSGQGELNRLRDHFNANPFTAGYVSRLNELKKLWDKSPRGKTSERLDGVVSVPWTMSGSKELLLNIITAVNRMGRGKWSFYLGGCTEYERQSLLNEIDPGVEIEMNSVGPGFLSDLLRADCALVYGGYNSLTDVLAAGIPAVVMLRGMKDGEQEKHARMLSETSPLIVDVIGSEEVGSDRIYKALAAAHGSGLKKSSNINLDGAAEAARYIHSFLGEL